MQINNWH